MPPHSNTNLQKSFFNEGSQQEEEPGWIGNGVAEDESTNLSRPTSSFWLVCYVRVYICTRERKRTFPVAGFDLVERGWFAEMEWEEKVKISTLLKLRYKKLRFVPWIRNDWAVEYMAHDWIKATAVEKWKPFWSLELGNTFHITFSITKIHNTKFSTIQPFTGDLLKFYIFAEM